MEILIYHPRQTGDVIIGAHCAKLVRKKYPDANIMFVTGKHLVDLIEPCSWIDMVLPEPEYNQSELVTEEDMLMGYAHWEWNDLLNTRTFQKMIREWKPDLSYRPRWNPDESPVSYEQPYIYRCFAACCDLTPEESNDTEYSLPVSEEERTLAGRVWETYCSNQESRMVLHMDHLAPNFEELCSSYGALLLDTSGKTSLRKNLAIIAEADLVVTRYGGVAIMAASVETPTVVIPKPEPNLWGHPIYSHPRNGHVTLLPKVRCTNYDGTSEHRLQPCQPGHGEYVQSMCTMGRQNSSSKDLDSFHCWRDVTVEDVKDHLRRKGWKA